MNNTDMETFWAVLEHGTLTAAAEALFITQPTLTNRIQSLEAEVGVQLFHRGKGIRHIELTEAGFAARVAASDVPAVPLIASC